MSNSENLSPEDNGDIDLPPISLPPPDEFETRRKEEGIDPSAKKGKKRKTKKQRNHPTDPYKDVRKEKGGCRGCCMSIGCFSVIAMLFVLGGVAYAGYLAFNPVMEGFRYMQFQEEEIVIGVAPKEPTVYWAPESTIIYKAAYTEVPVGIFAKNIEVSGSFIENVTIRGREVTFKRDAIFEKDLDIYSLKLIDQGMELKGSRRGFVLKK